MFEEALRQAPREELVEHIQLQRELIQRLHRRVLELESSLEGMYTCSSADCGADSAADCRASPSEQQRSALSTNARPSPSHPAYPQCVGGASGGGTPQTARTHPLVTHRETSLAFNNLWRADEDGAVTAPEPRRQPPHPHTEEKAPTTFARLSFSSQRQANAHVALATSNNGTGATTASAPAMPALSSAAASSTELTSSSVDHPTLLEGIKEINYVLAAHRAGHPALPLPVVEELEDIRTRLLQGFKQTYVMGDGDDGTAQAAAAAACQAYCALPQGEEAVPYEVPLDLLFERRADAFSDASRVCPRWISPDSSRVVYGTSPHCHP
ncbi:hypothetical protein, conserved [Leishmania lindenbergi]|uniref:Uncharacterized protein n=1 Tax=Leishmania lindenbergi TaxID=651832 RepID=A0AAW3AFW0_9TRYP